MFLGSTLLTRALVVLAVVCGLWLLFRLFEWRSVYFPARAVLYTPDQVGLSYEDVTFVSEDDVRLHGWWIPANDAPGVVILCHGNAGNISSRLPYAQMLNQLGMSVFLFDYRGYGRSRGFPTEEGTYRDARAAYEYARVRCGGTDEAPIVAMGRSLGAAVAVQLALDKPLRGLVLENAFTSTVDMAKELYPFLPARWICGIRYDSLAKIGDVPVPKLIVHSPQDRIVPFRHGQKLFEAAPEPKAFLETRGDHNDLAWETTPGYLEALRRFLHLFEE